MPIHHPELLQGTALPTHPPGEADQTEGRGGLDFNPERAAPSLLERVQNQDNLSPQELRLLLAALLAYDRRPSLDHVVYARAQGESDADTGNCIIGLYPVPAGMRADVTNVTVDAPGSSLTPSAPGANAASYLFLAAAGATDTNDNTAARVTQLRAGAVAFAPTAAAGPIIPGQWTFSEKTAPIVWGGQMLYFVLVGGTQAAFQSLRLQVTYRLKLTEHPH